LLLFIYLCFALYVFFRADSMIFLPPSSRYRDTPEILKIPVTANAKISALYLPNPQATYTLLYSHGNASDLNTTRPMLELLNSWGFSVFAYDYRGYGTSDGTPSEQNAYADVEAAYQYLVRELKVPENRIIAYGRSLGGGPSVELAKTRSLAGLVLESTFTSAFRVVVPIPILPFDKFPNLSKLPQVKCPVLVMQGRSDEVVPSSHGPQLYGSAPQPKLSLWVDGARHNDFTDVAGDRHRAILQKFQQLLQG
jgi:hypothetical protein